MYDHVGSLVFVLVTVVVAVTAIAMVVKVVVVMMMGMEGMIRRLMGTLGCGDLFLFDGL